MYFKYRPSQACFLLLTALALAEPSMAGELRYGFGLELGQVSLSTSAANEIDKDGQSFGAMASIMGQHNAAVWGLGVGFSSANLKGEQSERAVKQDLGLDLVFVDMRYLYLISEDLGFGPSIRGYYGKGAKHGVTANEDIDFMLSPGLALQYSWTKEDLRPALALAYYRDVNISQRDVSTVLLSLSLSTSLAPQSPNEAKGKESEVSTALPEPGLAEAAALEAASVAAAVAAPTEQGLAQGSSIDLVSGSEAPEALSSRQILKAIVLTIEPNSGTLTPEAAQDLVRIAKVLETQNDNWTKLNVSGHSDRNGLPAVNKQLSRKRAEVVCESLSKKSLSKDKMTCVGLGSEQLLPSLPARARAQRRVEILIEAKDKESADALEKSLAIALAK